MEHSNDSSWTLPSQLGGRTLDRGGQEPASQYSLRIWGPLLAAGVLFGVLMFSFLGVLQQAVARGEQQRLQLAEQAQAELRCRSVPSLAARRSCLAEMAAARALASLR